MPGRPHVSISTQNTWNLHLFIAYGLNLILWCHGSHIHHNVSSWIVPPWQILILCWSVQVHGRLSHCLFSSARSKSAASPGPTKQLRRETTAALQRGPSPQLLQCCSAGQPSKPVGPQNWKLITFWTKMHTVLVIFYQNCTIMSKTCGTFILFLFYANANVETRHVVTVQDTALTSFYN